MIPLTNHDSSEVVIIYPEEHISADDDKFMGVQPTTRSALVVA